MTLDARLAAQALAAADRITDRQRDLDRARDDFQRAVRALYLAGGSLRELAEHLGLSHQRIHQLLDLPRSDGSRGRRRGTVTCSFCEREQQQVRKMIAGPNGVAICNDCVDLADTVATHHAAASDSRTSISPATSGRCSFCGKRPDEGTEPVELLTAEAGAEVCTECLALCHDILSGEDAKS